jgi:hypothetical protein
MAHVGNAYPKAGITSVVEPRLADRKITYAS